MLFVIDEDVEAYNYADDNNLLSSGYELPTVKQKCTESSVMVQR